MTLRSFPLAILAFIPALLSAQVSESPSRTIRTGKAEVTALAIAPKGDHVLVGLNNGAALHHIESGKKVYPLTYNEDGGTAVYHVGFNEKHHDVCVIQGGRATTGNCNCYYQ